MAVITKLPKQIWISQRSDESLRVEQLFLEIFIGDKCPRWNRPGKAVEMASVDQFVWNTIMDGGGLDSCKVELVVESTDEDEPMRSYLQYFLSTNGGCSVPIGKGVSVSPCCI